MPTKTINKADLVQTLKTASEVHLEDYLKTGQENRTADSKVLALSKLDKRELRRAIDQSRRRGIPVCYKDKHLYIAKTSQEFERALTKEWSNDISDEEITYR